MASGSFHLLSLLFTDYIMYLIEVKCKEAKNQHLRNVVYKGKNHNVQTYCYFSFNSRSYYYKTLNLEKVFIDFGLRSKVSVRPICIWYHWKGIEDKNSGLCIIHLSHVVKKLWCFKDLETFLKVGVRLLFEIQLLNEK